MKALNVRLHVLAAKFILKVQLRLIICKLDIIFHFTHFTQQQKWNAYLILQFMLKISGKPLFCLFPEANKWFNTISHAIL